MRSSTLSEISKAYRRLFIHYWEAELVHPYWTFALTSFSVTSLHKYILVSSIDRTADCVVKAIYSIISMIFTLRHWAVHVSNSLATRCINMCRSTLFLKQLDLSIFTQQPSSFLFFPSQEGQKSGQQNLELTWVANKNFNYSPFLKTFPSSFQNETFRQQPWTWDVKSCSKTKQTVQIISHPDNLTDISFFLFL